MTEWEKRDCSGILLLHYGACTERCNVVDNARKKHLGTTHTLGQHRHMTLPKGTTDSALYEIVAGDPMADNDCSTACGL